MIEDLNTWFTVGEHSFHLLSALVGLIIGLILG